MRNAMKFRLENATGRDDLRDVGVNGVIILNRMLARQYFRM